MHSVLVIDLLDENKIYYWIYRDIGFNSSCKVKAEYVSSKNLAEK